MLSVINNQRQDFHETLHTKNTPHVFTLSLPCCEKWLTASCLFLPCSMSNASQNALSRDGIVSTSFNEYINIQCDEVIGDIF